ncbi:hypothetical protein [Paenibacillus planticolens]|uniref:Uncharacterized protein n=1 Tax=Paenibacillus planticolens TaxID=2654976 RepID=A0ABX1ZN15_9BACL|nr:hypothetical protein [Paenibacillus planticolens]NOV01341.1 hypothetical protein [Paenibacillus planticolens]
MKLNDALPQFGIIMDVQGQTARVFLPLATFETGYIPTTVSIDSNMIGCEVVVIFINGNRNQGVILGILQDEGRVFVYPDGTVTIRGKTTTQSW